MSNNCQVPTPKLYVHKLLDSVEYETDIFGKKILENSCGEGEILLEIVKRYISDGIRKKKSLAEIKKRLAEDIIGYEIDSKCIPVCKSQLDKVAKEFGIKDVNWKLINDDYLQAKCVEVDYIVGNPPYITYHDLSEKTRADLSKAFESCKQGRFDYYYPFVEKSLCDLNSNGKMAYLVPFNIFRNNSARELRTIILPSLQKIYDYSEIAIFSGILISSTIIVCDKASTNGALYYHNEKNNTDTIIEKEQLSGKWIFNPSEIKKDRFGDFFHVSNSVATLLNDAFIISSYESEDKKYMYVNGYKLEKDLIKNAISPRSIKQKNKKWIIYPYRGLTAEKISENELKRQYPGVYSYLSQYRDRLEQRKRAKNTKWYEYGRSQAITEIHCQKLIMPMVISENMTVAYFPEEAVPYAGYYIRQREDVSLEVAKKILESADFMDYIRRCGTPTTGESYRVSVKDIEAYTFLLDDYV